MCEALWGHLDTALTRAWHACACVCAHECVTVCALWPLHVSAITLHSRFPGPAPTETLWSLDPQFRGSSRGTEEVDSCTETCPVCHHPQLPHCPSLIPSLSPPCWTFSPLPDSLASGFPLVALPDWPTRPTPPQPAKVPNMRPQPLGPSVSGARRQQRAGFGPHLSFLLWLPLACTAPLSSPRHAQP